MTRRRKTKTSTEVKNRWNKDNYDKVYFCVPKGGRDEIAAAAQDRGMSLAAYLRHLIIAADGEKCPSLAGMFTPPPPRNPIEMIYEAAMGSGAAEPHTRSDRGR